MQEAFKRQLDFPLKCEKNKNSSFQLAGMLLPKVMICCLEIFSVKELKFFAFQI